MYLITPKKELYNLLELNNSQVVKDFGDELLYSVEIKVGKNHFYFNACILTNEKGRELIDNSCIDYIKICFLSHIYELLFLRDDLLFDVFGNVKLSVDLFDKYWNLIYPSLDINTDNCDETLMANKNKFIFPKDNTFETFLRRLGLLDVH